MAQIDGEGGLDPVVIGCSIMMNSNGLSSTKCHKKMNDTKCNFMFSFLWLFDCTMKRGS